MRFWCCCWSVSGTLQSFSDISNPPYCAQLCLCALGLPCPRGLELRFPWIGPDLGVCMGVCMGMCMSVCMVEDHDMDPPPGLPLPHERPKHKTR